MFIIQLNNCVGRLLVFLIISISVLLRNIITYVDILSLRSNFCDFSENSLFVIINTSQTLGMQYISSIRTIFRHTNWILKASMDVRERERERHTNWILKASMDVRERERERHTNWILKASMDVRERERERHTNWILKASMDVREREGKAY